MYATTGAHFVSGSHLTWSIEPDGTNLGSANSNLISQLNARFGAGNWLQPIQDAFAVWENVANINTVQVSDDGEPIDSGGYQQGSPSFGDIRIGGFGLDPSVLGFTLLPPPANGGSESGDIILNSTQIWQIGGGNDLESVMIHEIGHALGMGHSADPTASMYPFYHGVQQYVAADDVAGVQSIWSPRQEDGFVVGLQNFDAAHAVNITQYTQPNDQIILGPLDVAKSSESYWFKVTTPANASNIFQAAVQSTNLSELSPRVAIFDANLHGLWQYTAPANAYGTIIQASLYNATPNTTYYVRVSGSNAGPTGTGAYALMIDMGTVFLTNFVPATTQVLAQHDQGGGGLYDSTNGQGAASSSASSGNSATVAGPSATVAPAPGSWGGTGNSANQRLLNNLGAWENIHSFSRATQSGGGTPMVDTPDVLTIGNYSFMGDFLLTTPAPTNAPSNPTQDTAESAFIPLDPPPGLSTPTTHSDKKDSAVTFYSVIHPTGPF
jgi:hypothetical protein